MTRADRLRGIASIALLTAVLAACGSSAQAAQPVGGQDPTPDPTAAATAAPVSAGGGAQGTDDAAGLCAHFPAARATAALGEPVGAGKATSSATFHNASCHYEATGSDASITIWYHPGLTRADWEASMAKIGMTATMAVSGIGEAAYRQDGTSAHPRVKLAVFEGDHDIWVIIADAGDVAAMAATAEREARELLPALR